MKILSKYSLKILQISLPSSISLSFSTDLKFYEILVWESRFHSLPETFWKIAFCEMFFCLFARNYFNFFFFFYSFREVFILLDKNLLQSLGRLFIALSWSFVINFSRFALIYFFSKGACFLKISVNKFRKCWYSMSGTATVSLWKSVNLVSGTLLFWKLRGQSVRSTSIHDGFSSFFEIGLMFY